MNQEANKNLHASELKMNSMYQKIQDVYSADTLFIKNFRRAQASWKKYANDQAEAMFPEYPNGHYGSMLPLCVSTYKRELIIEHMNEMKKWLDDGEEGDCSSSINKKKK